MKSIYQFYFIKCTPDINTLLWEPFIDVLLVGKSYKKSRAKEQVSHGLASVFEVSNDETKTKPRSPMVRSYTTWEHQPFLI